MRAEIEITRLDFEKKKHGGLLARANARFLNLGKAADPLRALTKDSVITFYVQAMAKKT
jgi:hypothetical protein